MADGRTTQRSRGKRGMRGVGLGNEGTAEEGKSWWGLGTECGRQKGLEG